MLRLRQRLLWYHNQTTYPHEPPCGGRFIFVGFFGTCEHKEFGKVMRIRCSKCKEEKRLFVGIYSLKQPIRRVILKKKGLRKWRSLL